jgi:hypothetical protein
VSAILAYPGCAVVAGFTHADTENVLPSEIPGVATLLEPLKLSPPFIFPVVQLAPLMMPWYPLPDVSAAVVPKPASKPQYPINPPPGKEGGWFPVTVNVAAVLEVGIELPAAVEAITPVSDNGIVELAAPAAIVKDEIPTVPSPITVASSP